MYHLRFCVAYLGLAIQAATFGFLFQVQLQPGLPIIPIGLLGLAMALTFAAGQRFADHKSFYEARRYRVTWRAGR